MQHQKLRAQMSRLISGEFHLIDLTDLFLFARDKSKNNDPIKEIGNFIAHPAERKKGTVHQAVKEWSATIEFFFTGRSKNGALDFGSLPSIAQYYFTIATSRIDPKIVKQGTGVGQKKANKMLNQLSRKLQQNPDGTWRTPPVTMQEKKLLELVSTALVSKSAFSSEQVCTSFLDIMVRQQIICKQKAQDNEAFLARLIDLFIISKMNNMAVWLDSDTKITIYAAPNLKEQKIEVYAPVGITDELGEMILITPLYSAGRHPLDCCSEELFSLNSWEELPIELGADLRLHQIQ